MIMGVGLRLMLLVFFHSSTYGHENSKRLNATIRILARDVIPKRASKQATKQTNKFIINVFFLLHIQCEYNVASICCAVKTHSEHHRTKWHSVFQCWASESE